MSGYFGYPIIWSQRRSNADPLADMAGPSHLRLRLLQ